MIWSRFGRGKLNRASWAAAGAELATDDSVQRFPDFVEMEGFSHQWKRADVAGLTVGINGTGHQNHGNPRQRPIVKLRTAELRTVHHRQHEIEKNDAGLGVRPKVVECVASIRGRGDVITICAERDPQQIARLRIVVHDEDGAAVR